MRRSSRSLITDTSCVASVDSASVEEKDFVSWILDSLIHEHFRHAEVTLVAQRLLSQERRQSSFLQEASLEKFAKGRGHGARTCYWRYSGGADRRQSSSCRQGSTQSANINESDRHIGQSGSVSRIA